MFLKAEELVIIRYNQDASSLHKQNDINSFHVLYYLTGQVKNGECVPNIHQAENACDIVQPKQSHRL